jgi:hypothetical protein
MKPVLKCLYSVSRSLCLHCFTVEILCGLQDNDSSLVSVYLYFAGTIRRRICSLSRCHFLRPFIKPLQNLPHPPPPTDPAHVSQPSPTWAPARSRPPGPVIRKGMARLPGSLRLPAAPVSGWPAGASAADPRPRPADARNRVCIAFHVSVPLCSHPC